MKNNVKIIVRERGKIVARRESHNIWTQEGKLWLGHLASFASFDPLLPAGNFRIRYMGFGVGGHRQTDHQAFVPPLSIDYPGSNVQDNMDDRVSMLERPVTYDGSVWMRELVSTDQLGPYSMMFTMWLDLADISFGSYLNIPISEIGLSYKDIGMHTPVIAYDVFDAISKSSLQDMTVFWTVRL